MAKDKHNRATAEKIALLKIDSVTKVLLQLVRTGGYCFIAYSAFRVMEVTAGKKTIADLTMNLLANVTINKWVAYALAGLGWGYGLYERRVRRKTIKRYAPLIEERERKLDPKRSSSGLTEDGRTGKGDE